MSNSLAPRLDIQLTGSANFVNRDQINVNYIVVSANQQSQSRTLSHQSDIWQLSVTPLYQQTVEAEFRKYSPYIWRPLYQDLPVAIELIDVICTLLEPSNTHSISELIVELKELRTALVTVGGRIERYRNTPLNGSLALTISPALKRCHLHLFYLHSIADGYRRILKKTSISELWRRVFRCKCEDKQVLSLRNELLRCRKTFEMFSQAFDSIQWMELGSELLLGPLSFSRINTALRQRMPSLQHIHEVTVIVVDHLGVNLPIPLIFCSTWEGFDYMLKSYCKNRIGSHHVEQGDYRILQTQGTRMIAPAEYEERIHPGMSLEMSILLRRPATQVSKYQCPRCCFVDTRITEVDDWIECGRCSGLYQVATVVDNDHNPAERNGSKAEKRHTTEKHVSDQQGNSREDGTGTSQSSNVHEDERPQEIVSPASQRNQQVGNEVDSNMSMFRRINILNTEVVYDAERDLQDVMMLNESVRWNNQQLEALASRTGNNPALSIIGACLSLVPVPHLNVAFSIFSALWFAVENARWSNQQFEALAFSIAQLLQTLNREIQNGNIVPGRVSFQIINLQRIIADILSFVTVETGRSFFKLLFTSDDRVVAIETHYLRLAGCVNAFQISALINVREWQHRNDLGRAADQETLNRRLTELEANQSRLAETLDEHRNNMIAMMTTLQKLVTKRLSGGRKRQFFSHILDYLSTISGKHVELEGWMVTSYEVDFGPEIGSGGFGRVFKGTWNRTEVALKVLKTETGETPSSSLISREIRTWMNLRHPYILQFLGANVFDDRPFIVMPYLKNGNARDYICKHPDCNRLTILHHICFGLVYLHANNVIHGDLKAVNILINNAGNAVLCDFGLSRIKADATSRSTNALTAVTGSRNWMSPERMMGGPLRKPVDIYAFGMTVYEILTGEVPLGHIPYLNFIQLVVKEHTRPKRPEDDCFDISDGLWSLAEACWSAVPTQRPTAEGICDAMESLSNPAIQSWTAPSVSPSTSMPALPSSLSLPQFWVEKPAVLQKSPPGLHPPSQNNPSPTSQLHTQHARDLERSALSSLPELHSDGGQQVNLQGTTYRWTGRY